MIDPIERDPGVSPFWFSSPRQREVLWNQVLTFQQQAELSWSHDQVPLAEAYEELATRALETYREVVTKLN